METESSSFSKPGTCLAEPEMAWRQGLGGAVALDFENLYHPKGLLVISPQIAASSCLTSLRYPVFPVCNTD